MYNTFGPYVKNRGTTQTIISNNNNSNLSQVNWNAVYDGNEANISVDINSNGNLKHYDVYLDNQDLANILNLPSVDLSLDKRLKRDFGKKRIYSQPQLYKIELEQPSLKPIESLTNAGYDTHISSPLQEEEYIIPINLTDSQGYKTHKTYRAYKKNKSKSTTRSKSSHNSSKRTKHSDRHSNRRTSKKSYSL